MPTGTTDNPLVTDAADNIERVANDTGSASTKMLDEVNKQLNDKGFKGNDDNSKAVAKKLEDDKVLPKLIIAEFDNDNALKEFGDGKKFDIHKLEDAAQGKGEHDSPSERMLAQAFLFRLKAIDAAGNADGNITKEDLEAWAKKETDKTATLSPEVLDKTADELHAAINRQGFAWSNDPDKEKIMRLLEPLNEADRAGLERTYHAKFDSKGGDDTLRRELKDKLGGDNSVDWRKAEAVLNRHDGRTNDAGALMVALTQMNGDKDKGNTMLRNILETLNDKQLADLDKDFREKYGKSYIDAINQNKNLNGETKEALPILTKGVEHRTADDLVKLADIAVQYHNLQMFGEAVRGDSKNSKEAEEARRKLQNDPEFLDRFAKAFPSEAAGANGRHRSTKNLTFDQSVNQIALDYLREGRISLATITEADTNKWLFDNKENVALAARNASEKERTDFIAGKELALSNEKKDLTPEQKAQLDYYNKIHSAFKHGGNDREVSIWEDDLEHGQETIISQMAHSHDDGKIFGWFSNTNKQQFFSAVENLSESDWQRLKGINPNNPNAEKDPAAAAMFRKEIEHSLDSYASKEEKARVLALLDEKVKKDKYEDTLTVKRSIDQTIDDNQGTVFLRLGTSYNDKNIVDQIVHMSPEEATRYKDNADYRSKVNKFVQDHLNETEKLLVHHVLSQIEQNGKPVESLKPVDKVLLDTVDGASDSDKLKHIEAALKDQDLRNRLNQPDDQLSDEDKKIKRVFERAFDDAYYKIYPTRRESSPELDIDLQKYHNQLFQNGIIPIDLKLKLDYPKADVISEIAGLPADERAKLRAQLSPQEQQVLDGVASNPNHEFSTVDRMRLFIINDGGNYSDFKQQLETIHKDKDFNAIQNLKEEYAKKYHGDLDNDFLGKVAEKDKGYYTDLLTPHNGDGRQTFYNNLSKLLNESGVVFDGTGLNNQRSIDQFASTLSEYQKIYQTLPRDRQEALDKYFNDSIEQYKSSKEKLAEIASTALITAAALTVIVATGGTATPLVMAAAFAAGGITKNLVAMGIEGSDFQLTAENIAKNFVSGGVTAAANFFGGEALGFGKTLGTIGEAVAGDVVKDVGATAMREGGKDLIEKSLPELLANGGGKLSGGDLAALVDRVAAPGASQAEKDLIRQSIEAGISRQSSTIDGLVNNSKLRQVIQGALESGATGGVVNMGTTVIDDVLNGQPINVQNMLVSGLTGFAMGTAIHLVASGVSGAKDYFTVKKRTTASGGEELIAEPEIGKIEYVKRGDDYYRLDGDKDPPFKLQDGDVLLTDVPTGQTFADLPAAAGKVPDFEVAPRSAILGDPGDTLGWWGRFKDKVSSVWSGVWDKLPTDPKFTGPNDVAVSINGKDFHFDSKGELPIGRFKNSTLGDFPTVSRDQGLLKYEDGKFYYTDLDSANGTYVKRSGSNNFERLPPNQKVEIGPNDEIRFADPNFGPKLELFQTNGPNVFDVSINGESVPVTSDGRVDVGLNHPGLKGGQKDLLDRTVSRDHGTLLYDPNTQQFKFTDKSSNGSFIKHEDGSWTQIYNGQILERRQGADKWIPKESGSTVAISPTDEIHLGTEGGPKVSVYKTQGRTLADGSVLYRRPDGDTIVRPDGSSIRKNNAGEQVIKDPAGRVLRTEGAGGRSIDYSYNTNGNLANVHITDAQGNITSYSSIDGTFWSKYVPDPNNPGQFLIEPYTGKVEVQMDGSIKLTPADQKKPVEIQNVDGSHEKIYSNGYHEYEPSDYATEKANLKAVADHAFGDVAQRDRFLNMAKDFEARAKAQGLSQEQVAGVYQQVDRLLDAGPNALLNEAERARLAEQLMYNAAYPRTIDQGFNNTCNVTTVEARAFSRNPEDAAKMITDVALTGKYVKPDGAVVDIARLKGVDFIPDNNEVGVMAGRFDRNSNSPFPSDVKIDGNRNWADEIFQNTAVNVHYSNVREYYDPTLKQMVKLKPDETIQYVKTKPAGKDDTGEHLVVLGSDGRVLKEVEIGQAPGIDTGGLQDVYNSIVPSHGVDGSIQPGIETGFILTSDRVGNNPNLVVSRSPTEFEMNLNILENRKSFPAIMWVDVRKSEYLFGKQGGTGSHVILIEGIHYVNGKPFVDITNQWGSSKNFTSVPLDMLYGVLY